MPSETLTTEELTSALVAFPGSLKVAVCVPGTNQAILINEIRAGLCIQPQSDNYVFTDSSEQDGEPVVCLNIADIDKDLLP
ncbi:hypothetical protein ABV540_003786 [Vibrio fluvialis]